MKVRLTSGIRSRNTICLRLENDLMDHLRRQSEESSESINARVNKILRLYYSWYLPAQRAGLQFVHKDLLGSLVENLSPSQITKIGKQFGDSTFKGVIEMFGKEYSLPCIIDFIRTWLQVTALPYWHEEIPSKITYVIEHGMSQKLALLLEKVFENLLEEIAHGSYDVTSSASTIRITIYLKQKAELVHRNRNGLK